MTTHKSKAIKLEMLQNQRCEHFNLEKNLERISKNHNELWCFMQILYANEVIPQGAPGGQGFSK